MPLPLRVQLGLGIGGGGVRLIAALLAVEIALAVAAGRRRLARAILGPEALHRGPRRDLRAVHREVLVRQQARAPPCGPEARPETCAQPRPPAAGRGSS